MAMVTAGSSKAKYFVGATLALGLGQACDSGSSTSFEDPDLPGGSSGGGMANVSGGGQGSGGVAGTAMAAGASNGGAATAGSAGTAGGGTAGTGASAGTGGTSGGAGAPTSEGGMAGEGGEGGQAGAGSDPNAGGNGGSPDGMGGQGSGGDGSICERVLVGSKPRPSKVMLLMDRSGTMFEPPQTAAWPAVRDAVLPVIDAYDGFLDIGFMAMTGEAATCPLLDEVAPAVSNYAAISSKYAALAKPTKGESPFGLALSRAQQLLDGAPASDSHVIFVVDGHPDYCDDGNDACAIDSVISRLQKLRSAGITTLVGALPTYQGADAARYTAAVQAYANAGAGLPTACVTPNVSDTHYQCNTISPGWTAEFAAGTKPVPQALADYSATPGSAVYESLDPTSPAALGAAFGRLFARTLSCKLELTNGAKLDATQAAQGSVKIDGQPVAYDADNGWRLNTTSEIELVGNACTAWRTGTTPKTVVLDFPCASVSY